jgi:hypothetical protein
MAFSGLRGSLASLPQVWTVLLLLSCGGSPAGPSDAGVTLTILSPLDTIRVNTSVDMTLQAILSDGQTTVITPLWSTDRPEIVTVKPLSASRQGQAGEEWDGSKTGTVDHILFARVTGLSPGDAYVIATSRYGTARRPIRVTAE